MAPSDNKLRVRKSEEEPRAMRGPSPARLIGLSIAFLVVSVYYGQGPAVLLALLFSNRALAHVYSTPQDLPPNDPGTQLLVQNGENLQNLQVVSFWIGGSIALATFIVSGVLLVLFALRSTKRLNVGTVVVGGVWLFVLAMALINAPAGGVMARGGAWNFVDWSGN